jgi:hypothetical protein
MGQLLTIPSAAEEDRLVFHDLQIMLNHFSTAYAQTIVRLEKHVPADPICYFGTG